MAEEKKFIDEAGLTAFWSQIETALTRMYQKIPDGMQVSRIYQKNGRLHLEIESFGGATEDAKKAARKSLKVGIYESYDLVENINARTQRREFNHGDIITISTYPGIIDNPYPFESLKVNPGDSIIRCIIDGPSGHVEFWQKLAYKTYISNIVDPADDGHGINVITSVTQNESDSTIKVTNRKVGLTYVDEAGTTGTHCMKFS
jgi:hypothetical protein